MQAAGVDPRQTNYIAFSGGGDSLASIIGGQVTVGVGGYSELIEQVKAGNLRALGISAVDRVPGVDMPTLREQGVDVTFSNWRGVAAPPKLSAEQRKAYLALIDKVVKSPSWKGHLEKNGWVDCLSRRRCVPRLHRRGDQARDRAAHHARPDQVNE